MNYLKSVQLFGLILLHFCLLLSSCQDSIQDETVPSTQRTKPKIAVSKKTGCQACHDFTLDASHNFSCVKCHAGDNQTTDKQVAHETAIARPAHPNNMAEACGSCHEKIIETVKKSLHFTLTNEINSVRKAFGAQIDLEHPDQIPDLDFPTTSLELADDLLRRRCLRCHLYYPGDAYGSVIHGTGCASCHLDYQEGQLSTHQFIKTPQDKQCLSCHYGNFVGSDYYGKFEQDYNWEYWTPFSPDDSEIRPYGVGQHALRPDIHYLSGLSCIDCHSGKSLKSGSPTEMTCLFCHDWKKDEIQSSNTDNLAIQGNDLVLTTKLSKQEIIVPPLRNPAHKQYGKSVNCQVCHAQWSFADRGIHLFRQDNSDYEIWQALTRQGSSEVEFQLETSLFQGNDESDAFMADKLSGQFKIGIWLKGYELRRWEDIETCLDDEGMLQVCRSTLDLHLTYINLDNEVMFDSIGVIASTPILTPYTPHTTGKAGPFFYKRLPQNPIHQKK